jgi:glyoxalase family protein
MHMRITGFHHITMITGDAQQNLDFYTGPLGLRLVKLNVNMDDPSAYHLYYGDGSGSVGSILTFFPYPVGRQAKAGKGMIVEIDLDVPSGALDYWKERLSEHRVGSDPVQEDASGRRTLGFRDPEGLALRLVEVEGGEPAPTWAGAEVPQDAAIRRFVGIRIAPSQMGVATEKYADSRSLLRGFLGFKASAEASNRLSPPGSDDYVEILPDDAFGFGNGGHGSVHHVAFSTPDAAQQAELRAELIGEGFHPSPVMERNYFKSVYFREPSAVLYEIATSGPGLTIDEPLEELGTRLSLPPWLEEKREIVEAHLPKLVLPNRVAVGR